MLGTCFLIEYLNVYDVIKRRWIRGYEGRLPKLEIDIFTQNLNTSSECQDSDAHEQILLVHHEYAIERIRTIVEPERQQRKD